MPSTATLLPPPTPLEKSAQLPELTGQITSGATHDNLTFQVRIPTAFKTQALDPNQIKYLRLWVKGYGLNQRNNQEGYVPVTNFNGITLQVPGIPKGPNRVVVAQAYDANKQPIPAGLLKGYYSSLPDVHNITIYLSWRFTPTADVLETLINEQNPLAKSLDTLNLQRRVDQAIFGSQQPSTVYVIHPSRLDAQSIAQDIKTSGGRIPDITPPQWPTQHNLQVQVNGLSIGATLQLSVNDPASQVLNTTAAAVNETFDLMRVAPGNWTLTAQITSATSIASGIVKPITPGVGTPPVVALPGITSFTPTSGANGSTVTITGVNFTAATDVKFNDLAATSFTVNSPTQITAIAPAGLSTGPIAITTPNGTVTSRNVFTYTPSAVITSFTPASSNSGSTVVLSGVNFTGATAVKFNGVTATYTVDNAGQITATVPANSGTGPITVTTPVGTATSATNHTNTSLPTISSFTPTTGPIGGAVTITGTHFNGATVVKFNTTTAITYTVNSPTQITAIVPVGATTGKITVTTPQGTVLSTTNFTPSGKIIFVDKDAAGLNNGTSWTNAYTTLTAALTAAVANDEIWIADGTYRPGNAGGARSLTFLMKNTVPVYGGFNGTEIFRSQRDWNTNVTILNGDLNGDDVGFTNIADNVYHVITTTTNTTIDGVTISGGNADGAGFAENWGGGIHNFRRSNTTITNCRITGNTGNRGGGIYLESAPSTTITNTTITGNRATVGPERQGGGIHFYNSIGTSNPILTNVTISNNTGTTGGGIFMQVNITGTFTNVTFDSNTGGALRLAGTATPTVANSTFNGNSGGGIYTGPSASITITNSTFTNNTGSSAMNFTNGSAGTITGCTFEGNTSAGGSSLYIFGPSSPTITNSIFRNNPGRPVDITSNATPTFINSVFTNNGGSAMSIGSGTTTIKGGVFAGHTGSAITSTNATALNIENSIFYNNSWTTNGGAIYCRDGSLSVKNSTFVNNSTTARGGAIYHGGTAATTQTMLNNIFWGNTATLGSSQIHNGSTIATLTRNILFGNLAGIGGSATITDGGGNLDADPQFINSADPDGADNLWRTNDDGLMLQGTSPALHTGTAIGAPATDILGTARPQGADVDRGAYEQ